MANQSVDVVHQAILERVKDITEHSGYSYGSRRMIKALTLRGYLVNRDKARELMREAEVQVRHRKQFKVTTNSHHKHPVFPYLVDQQFAVPQFDQASASDVTYIWTQEGWLYLAVVMDVGSRKIVGWSMSP